MRTPFPGIQCHVSHVPLDAMQCWLGFFSSGYYCCVRMKYRGKLMRLGSSAWRQKIEKQGTSCEIIWPCMALRLGALDLLSQKDRTLDFELWSVLSDGIQLNCCQMRPVLCSPNGRNYFYPLHLEPANFYGDEVGVYDIVLPSAERLAQALHGNNPVSSMSCRLTSNATDAIM